MQTTAIWLFSVLLAQQTSPKPADVKLVQIGLISEIDTTTRSFDLKTGKEKQGIPTLDNLSVGISINSSQRPARPGASTSPGRMPDEVIPDPTRPPLDVPTHVFLTDKTICKDHDKVMLCASLKRGDQVEVTGEERSEARGRGLYATAVVRTR